VVVAAGEQLLRDYPGPRTPEIVKLTVQALASACERAGRTADAIRWYEQAQARWPADEKAADWLYNAAVWREGLGDDPGALQAWQKYLQRYRGRPDAVRIAWNVGLILERQKDFRRAAAHWSGFQREWVRTAKQGQILLAAVQAGAGLAGDEVKGRGRRARRGGSRLHAAGRRARWPRPRSSMRWRMRAS